MCHTGSELQSVCVCVCVCKRERDNDWVCVWFVRER